MRFGQQPLLSILNVVNPKRILIVVGQNQLSPEVMFLVVILLKAQSPIERVEISVVKQLSKNL
jgi:hypothetical protein